VIDRRRYSNVVAVRYFTGADYGTDHYLVAAKITEKLSVSKRAAQKLDMERFNLKNLNDVEVKHYQVKI
jgi:hypothetical protein